MKQKKFRYCNNLYHVKLDTDTFPITLSKPLVKNPKSSVSVKLFN